MTTRTAWGAACALLVTAACATAPAVEPADTLLTNGRVYTFTWADPAADGTPAANAPHSAEGWRPDAEAIAIRAGRIVFTGSAQQAEAYRGPATRVVDLKGATALPGLVDSHVHVRELGQAETQLDLTGVATEEEAVARTVAYAAKVPKGEWVVGRGWDEGAWASRYPTMQLLSAQVPDHPVVLDSLHGFAVWGNKLAFEKAGITRATKPPVGGEILKDAKGEPTGTLLNRAVTLLEGAVPPPTPDQARAWVLAGLKRMARDGYTGVHEAGADAELMTAFEALDASGELPVRVYAMLSARDTALSRAWLAKGPRLDPAAMLTVRSVKAYYDGSLGSRGARLIDDYADQKGHRGVSGGNYGFDQALVAQMMAAGFQVGIHAIGDAGNRETLDFIQSVQDGNPAVRNNRNRIEHAQVVHPDDFARYAALGVIASVEPPHAVEDKPWAEARAWRRAHQGRLRVAHVPPERRPPGLWFGPHGLGPLDLLRPARGGDPPRQDATARGRLVPRATHDARGGRARLLDVGRVRGVCRSRPRHAGRGARRRHHGDGHRSARGGIHEAGGVVEGRDPVDAGGRPHRARSAVSLTAAGSPRRRQTMAPATLATTDCAAITSRPVPCAIARRASSACPMQSITIKSRSAPRSSAAARAISSSRDGDAQVTVGSKPSARHLASANGTCARLGVTMPTRRVRLSAPATAGTMRPGSRTGTGHGTSGKAPAHATTITEAPSAANRRAAAVTRGTRRVQRHLDVRARRQADEQWILQAVGAHVLGC